MRRRKCLVQIHVNDVEAHVAWSDLAADRVEIRAVVVKQATCFVHDLGNFDNAPFEHAERRRVGQHDASGLWSNHSLERFDVNVAVAARGQFAHDAATHRRSCRVGTMRSVRNDNLVALQIAACLVVGPNHCDACELTLRSRHRRQ